MNERRNFFVIGDLVIDHAVFVRKPIGAYQSAAGEDTYTVVRRQNTAGGAANTARILSLLYPHGVTYLWGIIGRSNWGTFRRILEDSQGLDGAIANVELRGTQDETDAPMNTITRLVLMEPNGTFRRVVRFDDGDHTHVSDPKRLSLLYHLERIHEGKDKLDAIILNDLDRGCLRPDIVREVAEFARRKGISLFVDPKRHRDKYKDIKGTAILPNLKEWCYLVDADEDYAQHLRRNLHNRDILAAMAEKSFHALGNFTYHVITCDTAGAILIAPHPKQRNMYAVYVAPPEPARHVTVVDPLGPGDVLTGVLAAEYDAENDSTEGMLAAFQKANAAVACYREMPYHRMPSWESIHARWQNLAQWSIPPKATPTKGGLFLPKDATVSLSRFRTAVPTLLSADSKFRTKIQEVLQEVVDGVGVMRAPNIILGAPSGSGKNEVIRAIRIKGEADPRLRVHEANLRDIVSVFDGSASAIGDLESRSVLFVVDEAWKGENKKILQGRDCVPLLNWAHDKNARFLFIDALFSEVMILKEELHHEIRSRCRIHQLVGIGERPEDIPYIIADRFLRFAASDGIREVDCAAAVLRVLIDRALLEENIRSIVETIAPQIYRAAHSRRSTTGPLRIDVEDLPHEIGQAAASEEGRFLFQE